MSKCVIKCVFRFIPSCLVNALHPRQKRNMDSKHQSESRKSQDVSAKNHSFLPLIYTQDINMPKIWLYLIKYLSLLNTQNMC